ncbi:hypothetical protein Ancab_029104, partial [Ancistrocladus abbreviatus]
GEAQLNAKAARAVIEVGPSMSVELGPLASASQLEIRCQNRPFAFGPQEMQEGSSPLAVFCSGQGNLASKSQLQIHNLAGAG